MFLVANPVPPPPDPSNTRAYTGWLKKTFPPGTPVVLTEEFSEGPAYAPIILPVGLKGEVQEIMTPKGWHYPTSPPAVVVNWYEPAPGSGDLMPPTPTSVFLAREMHSGSKHPIRWHDASALQPLIDTWGGAPAPLSRHHLPKSQRSWLVPNVWMGEEWDPGDALRPRTAEEADYRKETEKLQRSLLFISELGQLFHRPEPQSWGGAMKYKQEADRVMRLGQRLVDEYGREWVRGLILQGKKRARVPGRAGPLLKEMGLQPNRRTSRRRVRRNGKLSPELLKRAKKIGMTAYPKGAALKALKAEIRETMPPPTAAEIKKWNRDRGTDIMDVIDAYARRTGMPSYAANKVLQIGWQLSSGRLKPNSRRTSRRHARTSRRRR